MLNENLTMLTDYYELCMANGYFQNCMQNKTACFDMFFRKVPDGGGFAIMAGVEQLVDYLKNLPFTEAGHRLPARPRLFDERFLDYLRDFQLHLRRVGGAGGHADLPAASRLSPSEARWCRRS